VRCPLLSLLACLALPAAAFAQASWRFVPDAGEGPKFGALDQAGGNNFFPLWIWCEDGSSRRVVLNAYVGDRRPAGGRGSFSLTAAGEAPVTVSGDVASEPFDGLYTLEARLPWEHPLFVLLARGQPMTYVGGTTRASLGAGSLASVLARWRTACR
jgi:hypothetical protein